MSESEASAPGGEWTLGSALDNASNLLKRLGLPKQQKPEGAGGDYDFPTNVDKLTDRALGDLQLKLAAWLTYLMGHIGEEDAELTAFETVYELKLGAAMQANSVKADKRVVKDVLRAVTITDDASLTGLTQSLVTRRVRLARMNAQAKVYERQLQTLSREQSRREAQARINF